MVKAVKKSLLLSLISVSFISHTIHTPEHKHSMVEQAISYAQWRASTGFSGQKDSSSPDRQAYEHFLKLYKIEAALAKSRDMADQMSAVLGKCFADMDKKSVMASVELLCSTLAQDTTQETPEAIR